MRIGFIVDGQAEFNSLPILLSKIESQHTIIRAPLLAPMNGNYPVGQIVRQLSTRLKILAVRGVEHACVVLDREAADQCPGQLAQQIATSAQPCVQAAGLNGITVVLKDKMYENWLIADVDALQSLNGRFDVQPHSLRQVSTGGADRVDAVALLKRLTKKASYDKVADACRIVRVADPLRMGANSRSFRRFLRVVGHVNYRDQSRLVKK